MSNLAYHIIPGQIPKLMPFVSKTIDDVLTLIGAASLDSLEIIPIASGIIAWCKEDAAQNPSNIAFKLNEDNSIVFGKVIFTGDLLENGDVVGLSGPQVHSVMNYIQLPT